MKITPPIRQVKHPYLKDCIDNISNGKRKFLITSQLETYYKGILSKETLNKNRPEKHCNLRLNYNSVFYNEETKECDTFDVIQSDKAILFFEFSIIELKWLKYIAQYILHPLGFHLEMFDRSSCNPCHVFLTYIRLEMIHNEMKIIAIKDNKIVLKEYEHEYNVQALQEDRKKKLIRESVESIVDENFKEHEYTKDADKQMSFKQFLNVMK